MRFDRRLRSAAASRAVLRCASWVAPAGRREEWLAEWRAELWHLLKRSDAADFAALRRRVGPLAFCLGAFHDAVWCRRNDRAHGNEVPLETLESRGLKRSLVESPVACVSILAFLAVANAIVVTRFFDFERTGGLAESSLAHLLLLAFALVLLPVTTSLSVGEIALGMEKPSGRDAIRRWSFFGVKVALLVVIVFFGSFTILLPLSTGQVNAHGVLIGYVLAFRWAIRDQRKRCPVCLRLATRPTRIGQPSRSFLEWCGTEFLCERGHGLLYVPEFEMSYHGTRWVYLDPSWRSLFSSKQS